MIEGLHRSALEQTLCTECGLCCNGVIFADVKLLSGDNEVRLKELGLRLTGPMLRGKETSVPPRARVRAHHFPQPCTAFGQGRCNIYGERPRYCREFECLLLNNAKTGRVSSAQALKLVREAREQSDLVIRLLRSLGDTDEELPLMSRFHRTAERLQQIGVDDSMADTYSQLTLAVHDLNFLLSNSFYPG